MTKKALAQSLALAQETSAQILDELLAEERISPRSSLTTGTPVDCKPHPLDAEGFDQIHAQYRDCLVHSMTGFVRDRDKAEDIAAQAFEAAWEKREGFRGAASPLHTWIQAIARNEALQSMNRGRTAQLYSLDQSGAYEVAATNMLQSKASI